MFKNWFQVNKKQLVNKLGLHTITRKLKVAYNFCYCFVLTVPLPAVKFLNKLYFTTLRLLHLMNCGTVHCTVVDISLCWIRGVHWRFSWNITPPPTFLKIIFNSTKSYFFFAGGGDLRGKQKLFTLIFFKNHSHRARGGVKKLFWLFTWMFWSMPNRAKCAFRCVMLLNSGGIFLTANILLAPPPPRPPPRPPRPRPRPPTRE